MRQLGVTEVSVTQAKTNNMTGIIIIITILVLSILIMIFGIDYYNMCKDKSKEKTKISFKEGFDLTELPIVTFNSNNIKLHFLLDTGSNISFINADIIKELNVENLNIKTNTVGVGGTGIETHHYLIEIGYKDQKFKEEFGAVDLSEAFNAIEKESGIKIHGILGNRFFEKYKYIINFKELTAYR